MLNKSGKWAAGKANWILSVWNDVKNINKYLISRVFVWEIAVKIPSKKTHPGNLTLDDCSKQ